ncbi:hypothetical protein SUGI_0038360 [Cryptomeria japonica]|nr:hypothetical protein SUGI_0038360 [Cryptomeria japonica]
MIRGTQTAAHSSQLGIAREEAIILCSKFGVPTDYKRYSALLLLGRLTSAGTLSFSLGLAGDLCPQHGV